ncbi:hypothetical protein AAVH_29766 [Aphelenchoides avenae]|nr:hypothetical protein AAVH_29766 [Aphelenchus avenae]
MYHVIGREYDTVNWIVTGVTSASTIWQLYLVYLITCESPQIMRRYRPFLLLISAWDLLSTLMECLLVPDFLYPASCIVASGPISYLGFTPSLLAVGLFSFDDY